MGGWVLRLSGCKTSIRLSVHSRELGWSCVNDSQDCYYLAKLLLTSQSYEVKLSHTNNLSTCATILGTIQVCLSQRIQHRREICRCRFSVRPSGGRLPFLAFSVYFPTFNTISGIQNSILSRLLHFMVLV